MTGQERKGLRILIVDDEEANLNLYASLLRKEGSEVIVTTSSVKALEMVQEEKFDCVLSDLTMPELDGFDLFHKLKQIKNIPRPVFIVITGKIYDSDRRRAMELGISGFITKPFVEENFANEIFDIIENKVIIKFWGVRGTLPVPGKKSLYYGGNTNCVTLSFPKNFFIFDAGTGIKVLSDYLMQRNKFPVSAKVFISHPHWDHINAFPFFAPFYVKGCEFEIFSASPAESSVEKALLNQMDSIHFPVTSTEFSAKLSFHSIKEGSFSIDDIHIQTLLLNHPGRCLGFRVQYKDKIFCYVTDNEIYPKDSPYFNQFTIDRLISFVHKADVLVIDTAYSDEEYLKKINWGHSCVSTVIDIADLAKVGCVCLYHHDPDQSDEDIKMKWEHAEQLLKSRDSKTKCIVPRELDEIVLWDGRNQSSSSDDE